MRPLLYAVAGLLAALLALWLLLWRALAVACPGASLREAVRLLPDTLRLLRRLAADPAVPASARLAVGALLAYLAFPIDLVPDFIPVLGWADDAILTVLVLRWVVRRAGPQALRRHWPGTPEGLAGLARAFGLELGEG